MLQKLMVCSYIGHPKIFALNHFVCLCFHSNSLLHLLVLSYDYLCLAFITFAYFNTIVK